MVELLVAMAILAAVVIPLAWSIISERRLARAYYQQAVAMEVLDGEMEVLLAGEWRAYSPGQHPYEIHALSATNLPPGNFTLTINSTRVRLDWLPAVKHHGGAQFREATVQ
jgi:hypothetical protein